MKAAKRLGQSQLLMNGLQFYIQLLWMMDDLQFTSFFYRISVISRQQEGDNKGLVQWNPGYGLKLSVSSGFRTHDRYD